MWRADDAEIILQSDQAHVEQIMKRRRGEQDIRNVVGSIAEERFDVTYMCLEARDRVSGRVA